MRKLFRFLVLPFCFPGACFAQITPTGEGSVLTYDLYNARQQRYQKNISFELNPDQRVLQWRVNERGERTYRFMNDKPFAVLAPSLAMVSFLGKAVAPDERYPLLPPRPNVAAGETWRFSRKGNAPVCGNWNVTHQAEAKTGPDTSIEIDGKNSVVRTLLLEFQGQARSERCDPYQQERIVLYAPELNELVLDQWIDFTPDGLTSEHGYKWVLKTVTRNATLAPK